MLGMPPFVLIADPLEGDLSATLTMHRGRPMCVRVTVGVGFLSSCLGSQVNLVALPVLGMPPLVLAAELSL